MNFRIRTKLLFLTYPNSTKNAAELYTHLCTLFPRSTVITCNEDHADGSPHMHAGVKLPKRCDIRDPRYCDFNGFHPNIQAGKSWQKIKAYLKKGGDFICDEEADENGGDSDETNPFDICANADKEGWITHCIKEKIGYGYCESIWAAMHKYRGITLEPGITVSGTMCLRLLHQLAPAGKTIICIGPSGVGKTTWAKTIVLKPALWVTHMDELKYFDEEEHHAIIFDDMNFAHIPITAQIHLVDVDDARTLHIRYKTVTIPAGVQKIFTCNIYPFTENHEAIERRTFCIRL